MMRKRCLLCGNLRQHNLLCRRCRSTNETLPAWRDEVRYPAGPLIEFVDGSAERAFAVSTTTWKEWLVDGLSEWQADRAALRLGFHPAMLWPTWADDGLTVLDRIFVESGWRAAWEWGELVEGNSSSVGGGVAGVGEAEDFGDGERVDGGAREVGAETEDGADGDRVVARRRISRAA